MLGARMRRIFNADLMQSVPNQGNRPTLRREIPNIAGDYTMGPTNAVHFSKRLRWIRYKVNYKSRNNDVEGVVRERQLLRVRNSKIHALRDCFLARNFDLWLRRIDRDYCRGRARTDYKISKDSSATTDIEPARISRRCEPIEKDRTDGTGPAAHELLICGAIAKTLRVFGHFAPPSPRLNRRLSALCLHDRSTAEFNANRRCRLTLALNGSSTGAKRCLRASAFERVVSARRMEDGPSHLLLRARLTGGRHLNSSQTGVLYCSLH